MIGIIGAMESEVERLREAMVVEKTENVAGMKFYCGRIDGAECVVVRSGIGKVNAAICTQILCDLFPITSIWNTGIAGSLRAEINIGDIVISTDAVQHDMDARYFGYEPGVIPQQFPPFRAIMAAPFSTSSEYSMSSKTMSSPSGVFGYIPARIPRPVKRAPSMTGAVSKVCSSDSQT